MNINRIELKRFEDSYRDKVGHSLSVKDIINNALDSEYFQVLQSFNNRVEALEALKSYKSIIDERDAIIYAVEYYEADESGEFLEGSDYDSAQVEDLRFNHFFDFSCEIEADDLQQLNEDLTDEQAEDLVKEISDDIKAIQERAISDVVNSNDHYCQGYKETERAIIEAFEANLKMLCDKKKEK